MDNQNPFLASESHGPEHEDSQEVLAERAIADAGQSQAMYNYNQKLLEQKERELIESIALNYGRIREVERELGNVQLQLKLTSGPKKHALELLRKKIEAQNERVAYVRTRHTAAKAAYERLDAELKQEEAVKDQLCSELNTLVQQAAKAQMEKLEELKANLECLYSGIIPTQATIVQRNRQQQTQTAPTVQQQQQELAATSGPQQQAEACPGGTATITSEIAASSTASTAAPKASGAPAADEEQEKQRLRQEQERQEQERRAAEERQKREAEAATARSRHVSLASTSPGVAGGLATAVTAGGGSRMSGAHPAATSAAPAGTAGPQRGAGATAGANSRPSSTGAGSGGGAGPRPKVQNGGLPASAATAASKQRFAGFDT